MIRAALFLLLSLMPASAFAADRTIGVGSFDRLRVRGPFRVRVVTGPPRATVSGDRRAIEQVDVRADGTSLVVQMGAGGWGEQPAAAGSPLTVTLSTPALASAEITGDADVTIARMKGPRVDVSAIGGGTVAVAAVEAEAANVTVVGSAAVTVSGHADKARLLTNGPGTIKAGALVAGDLSVALQGDGETEAQARFTATVVSTGLGHVTVAGNPRCTVRAPAGGPVTCGRPS